MEVLESTCMQRIALKYNIFCCRENPRCNIPIPNELHGRFITLALVGINIVENLCSTPDTVEKLKRCKGLQTSAIAPSLMKREQIILCTQLTNNLSGMIPARHNHKENDERVHQVLVLVESVQNQGESGNYQEQKELPLGD